MIKSNNHMNGGGADHQISLNSKYTKRVWENKQACEATLIAFSKLLIWDILSPRYSVPITLEKSTPQSLMEPAA